jgi:hypothetical protein
MRTTVVFAGALAVFGSTLFAQISLPGHRPFQTSDQLSLLAGSESAAGAIVSTALGEFVRMNPTKTTTVIAAQIRENWLPGIPGVQFIRLSDDDARAHFQRCGKLLFVNSFLRASDDVVQISVAEGNRCDFSGLDFRFARTADHWLRDDSRVGGGFASGSSDCGC